VRLTEHQVEVIVRAVKSRFGDGACTYLFGSRLDDAMKGAILICLSNIRGWPISVYGVIRKAKDFVREQLK